MNKLMIALGMLLIAGVSFAFLPSWQYEWQNYASWRYNCQMENIVTEKYILADYMYVQAAPYVEYSQITALYGYLDNMVGANSAMHFDDYYATPFRADMSYFNSNNAAFNTVFNAVLRTYLAHGGDSSYVLGILNGFKSDNMECIAMGSWDSGFFVEP